MTFPVSDTLDGVGAGFGVGFAEGLVGVPMRRHAETRTAIAMAKMARWIIERTPLTKSGVSPVMPLGRAKSRPAPVVEKARNGRQRSL
jgi:hypothetical protein